MHFGMGRTKRMKSLLNWVQYFYLVSGDPTIVYMNEFMLIQNLYTALYRSDIRKYIITQSNTKDKEAYPGILDSEKNVKNGNQNS